ncbi:CopM family metallochaperone [Devosia sp. A449]
MRSSLLLAGGIVAATFLVSPAFAHVKWFAPYIVGASPQPAGNTLTNTWFWLAIALVLIFFVATRAVEKSPLGETVLLGMDKVAKPLWTRLDDFVRAVIGVFFVAIFAVGGIYLTPDLKTPYEWVSWIQLLIAFGVFSRKTMPFSAAGIILLWVLALTEYDFFHLLDYLALGVAVAGYLVLAASKNEEWRRHRFEVLRWGVAIALMWSSLEKFAYPEWFYPLVLEKPFLTFGMPRDVFIPMAGVAEFTMGFGLLWTPLVRRLSAISLFFIFNAAVYPFGRIDLVGHALIMAIIVAIAADPERQLHFFPKIRKSLAGVPSALAAALLVFATGYWGLHLVFYGAGTDAAVSTTEMATHTFDPENPHSVPGGVAPVGETAATPTTGAAATAQFETVMDTMHQPMMDGIMDPDPDVAFIRGMIPHHQGAIDMARVELKYGTDPENRALAEHIISEQEQEIAQMKRWLEMRKQATSE